MAKEYNLELMIKDDGRVICVCGAKAAVLNRTLAEYAARLVEVFGPAEKVYNITPPARSIELAAKANGPAPGPRHYYMNKTMVTILNSIAAFDDPVTANDVITLCNMVRGTVTSKLSMLTTNGYLVRVDKGKYMATPAGNAFLVEHSN